MATAIDIPNSRLAKIRVKASGQILEVLPAVARAMLAGGTAELFEAKKVETASIDPSAERAVGSPQDKEPRKPNKPKARSAR
jgi:hypothetical protein